MARGKKTNEENNDAILAASILYYDKEEFLRLITFFDSLSNDNYLKPTSYFLTFLKYMKDIIDNDEDEYETVKKRVLATIKKIEQANSVVNNTTKRDNFSLWFENVKSNCNNVMFGLADDILYRHLWNKYVERIKELDNSDSDFKDKLSIRPPQFNLNKDVRKFFHVNDINIDFKGKGESKFTTGSHGLDEFIDLYKGNFFVIAARPGVGKSVFMLQQCLNNAARGIKSLFVSLEMTEAQIMDRIFNWYEGKEVYDAERKAEIQKEKRFELLSDNFMVYCSRTHNAEYIFDDIKKSIEEFGADMVFVDYLQLMKFNQLDEWASLRKLTFEMKQFAMANNVLFVTCSQVSRESNNYGIDLTSLFGSSTIENDADVIMGIEVDSGGRMSKSTILGNSKKKLKFKILKNRQGSCANVDVEVDYVTMNYTTR